MPKIERADPPDANDRERAVVERERNVVVVAGAGSGKTSLLVERALYSLLWGHVEPGRFVAITFTEAAAQEMRRRMRDSLEDLESASGADPNYRTKEGAFLHARARAEGIADETLRARARAASASIPTSAITTIHGFCSGCLRRHPVEAGVPLDPRLDDGAVLETFVDAEWWETLRALDPNDPEAAFALETFDPNDLREWFAGLLHPSIPGAPEDPKDRDAAAREALGSWMGGWGDRLRASAAKITHKSGQKFAAWLRGMADQVDAILAGGLPNYLKSNPPRLAGGSNTTLPDEEIKFAKRVERTLEILRSVDDAAVARAVAVLRPFAAAARRKFLAAGWLSYDGLLVHTRNLLRDDPNIRREEGGRLQAILVDEFQDTDPLQYEIVFFLAEAAGGAPARDAWSVRLAPGRLFLVGDPKQSIYRFRGADIEAYRRAEEKVLAEGGIRLALHANFRSPAELLAPLHRLFSDWLTPQNEEETAARAAPSYESMVAHRDGPKPKFGTSPRVEVWSPEASDDSQEKGAAARRRREADWIADEIHRQLSCAPGDPAHQDSKGRHDPKDFAILLRAFSDVAIYAGALQRRGIPYLLEGGRTFYERCEVAELLAWIRVVSEPNDAVALLAVLRSAAGAVPDAELARYAADSPAPRSAPGRWSADAAVDSQQYPGIARTFALVRELRALAGVLPADDALRAILDRTRLRELHAAGFDGAQRIANLEKCQEIASRLAREDSLPIDGIAFELERRAKDSNDEGEGSLSESGIDAVSVLTIHASKGLEFDVLFLADLARAPRESRARSELAFREPAGPAGLRGLVASAKRSGKRTTASALASLREAIHAAAEDRRILYVAATRARERLVLVASEPSHGPANSWISRIRGIFGADVGSEAGTISPERDVLLRIPPKKLGTASLARRAEVDLIAAARSFEELAALARAGARPPIESPSGLREELEAEADDPGSESQLSHTRSQSSAAARAVGLAVHSLLETADFTGRGPLASDAAIESASRRAALTAGAEAVIVVSEVARLLAALAGGRLRTRLASARIVGRELPVFLRNKNPGRAVDAKYQTLYSITCTGIADLLIEERDGLVVVDWKTDEASSEAELRNAAARHRTQVSFYAQALSEAAARPVRGELFFVRLDKAVPL
jgi:ATP-dependent helicase/nuclease subunit A